MTTIEQAFFDAVLADISYVDKLEEGMTGDVLAGKIEKRISAPLAEIIGARFEVLAVKNDTSTGYQGVVFRDTQTKELYVANRGTEEIKDFIADGNLAVITGVASAQTASMINWWEQISNPAGTTAPQIKPGIIDQFVSLPLAPATGKIATALDQAGGKVRVVGHSLGGHLTTIFASLFSGQVSHSSTFNGAGLFSVGTLLIPGNWFVNFLKGEPLSQLADLIGSTVQLPESKQDNFYAYNGLSLTTNSLTFTQIGERIGLFNEQSAFPVDNHFMYKLTDSLALMVAMQQLDTSVTLAELNKMFDAASANANSSNEQILDGLRKILLGGNITATPVFDASDVPARTTYHQNLQDFINSAQFKLAQSKIAVVSLLNTPVANIINAVKYDNSIGMAYRYALKELNPFIVAGSDYSLFNQNGELDLYDPVTGTGTLTDAWITDRANMASWLLQANVADTATLLVSPTDGYALRYDDRATGKEVSLRQDLMQSQHRIVFGSDKSETTLWGEDLSDHLYGGGGDDRLVGFGGDDYIEGNSGNDTLEGGKGDDTLYGGTGFDTYIYNVGDGHDTIVDQDKQGQIIIKKDGKIISTTTLYKDLSGNIWKDATGSVTITHNSPWKIVLEDGGVIELGEEFQDGDFGIHLLDDNITTTTTIVGDLTPIPGTSSEFQYDAFGNKIAANVKTDALGNVLNDGTPSADRSDYLYDSADSDRIEAGGGNDVINAMRGGSDILIGGAGSDIIFGESGKDFITGGTGDDTIQGDVIVYADNYAVVAERRVAA